MRNNITKEEIINSLTEIQHSLEEVLDEVVDPKRMYMDICAVKRAVESVKAWDSVINRIDEEIKKTTDHAASDNYEQVKKIILEELKGESNDG